MFPRSLQCTALATFALIFAGVSAADYPQKAFEAKTMSAALLALFGTDRVEPSNDVQIEAGLYGARFHVTIAKPQRVALFATRLKHLSFSSGLIGPTDETPLIVVFDLTERVRPYFNTGFSLVHSARSWRIDVVALAQGKLYGASREIHNDMVYEGDFGGPHCPNMLNPKTLPQPLPAQNRASVVRANTIYGGRITRLGVGFKHPMESGWWVNGTTCEKKPRHLIHALRILHGSERIGDVWMGPGMGKHLSLMLDGPRPGNELSINWRDTAGTMYKLPHTIAPSDGHALGYAARWNDSEWAKRTLEEGADVNFRFRDGKYVYTALKKAAGSGSVEVARLLLAHGADVEAGSYEGAPLFSAIASGNPDMVQLLLTHGANLSVRQQGAGIASGDTPLTAALNDHRLLVPEARARHALSRDQILRLLIEAGADVNAKSLLGKSPLALARENHFTEAEAMLRKAGAKE